MTTQEITVRISKTIQEQQYEPLTAEVIIKEACPKKKYSGRTDELLDLASNKVFGYLGVKSDQAGHPEEIPADEGEFKEDEKGGEEAGYEEGQGEEGFENSSGDEGEEGQGEEGFEEGGEYEEGGEEGGGEEEGGGDEEFGDFFDDDPDGEVD